MPSKALALLDPDVAPHLDLLDLGGNGYATMRVSPGDLETEFVCIPRRSNAARRRTAGRLAYRAVPRVNPLAPGEAPSLQQRVVEGEPP